MSPRLRADLPRELDEPAGSRRSEAETADLPEAALDAVHPSIGRDLILRMQAGHGNAYVSRMAAEVGVSRYKRDTAAESVGADTAFNVDLPGGRGKKFMEIGDKGYTQMAMDILPEVAGTMFASETTQGQLMTPVQPQFADLKRTARWMSVQAQKAEDNSDTSFGGIADRAKADQKMWEAAKDRLVETGATEERLCKEYNAGVPRANRVFVSLAKLDGLMAIMGIKDPAAMVSAVVGSLQEAAPVANALRSSGKAAEKKTVPEADDSVTHAATQVTSAQEEMGNAWIGVQQTLESDRAA